MITTIIKTMRIIIMINTNFITFTSISITITITISTITTTTTDFMLARVQDFRTIGIQSFGIQHCIAVEVKMGVSVMVMMW